MSSEMPGWMNHKLESRFLQEISTTSDMQMCCCLVSQLYLTLCDCSTPGYPAFTISWSLLKLMSMKLEMPSNHLTLCCPLLLPSIFLSIKVFSSESAVHIRWPKYWSFSFSISLSSKYQGWFPLGLTDLISLQSKGLSRVFSNTTVQKHQFFSTQPCLWSNSHIHTWLLGKP